MFANATRISSLFALLIALVLSACAVTTHDAVPAQLGQLAGGDALVARASEPGEVRVTRVTAADWVVERGGLINLSHPEAEAVGLEDGDEPIQIYFYVIEHPTRGTFIVDTGVAAGFRSEDTAPVSWLVASAMNTEALEVRVDTAQWLAEHGPIDGVLLTHLHLDHIMGLPDIPKDVPIYTGPGEAAGSRFLYMFAQGSTDELLEGFGALQELPFEADPDGRFAGVLDLFGDGSVFALHVPGHTPGSTAYLARTPEGPQLIVGDASHTAWGWEHGVEPGHFNADGEGSARSLAQLKALEEALPGLQVHLGHQHLPSVAHTAHAE